jgi:hypothetical protein
MQIACARFGCQKAVEVCYWTCQYRRNCKDWKGAIEGAPGLEAIRERLEESASRSGRAFEFETIVAPPRRRRAPAPAHKAPRAGRENEKMAIEKRGSEKMARTVIEEETGAETATERSGGRKRRAAGAAKRRAAAVARSGPVYVLLHKNGKYQELRESELDSEAGRILKDPGLRLVKGEFLIPHITFRPAD